MPEFAHRRALVCEYTRAVAEIRKSFDYQGDHKCRRAGGSRSLKEIKKIKAEHKIVNLTKFEIFILNRSRPGKRDKFYIKKHMKSAGSK